MIELVDEYIGEIAALTTLLPFAGLLFLRKSSLKGYFFLLFLFLFRIILHVLTVITAYYAIQNHWIYNIYMLSELILLTGWFARLFPGNRYLLVCSAFIMAFWFFELFRIGINTFSWYFLMLYTMYFIFVSGTYMRKYVVSTTSDRLSKEFWIAGLFFLFYSNDILVNAFADTFYEKSLRRLAIFLVCTESFFLILQHVALFILMTKWKKAT
jgi:hypothetical protein